MDEQCWWDKCDTLQLAIILHLHFVIWQTLLSKAPYKPAKTIKLQTVTQKEPWYKFSSSGQGYSLV